MGDELSEIRARYERRRLAVPANRYDPFHPAVLASMQERERGFARLLKSLGPASSTTVLEIGCGEGANLLGLLRLGFEPENIVGNDLLEDRIEKARHVLPSATRLVCGDASELELDPFHVVLQSTVFSSILEPRFQQRLAARMWTLVRPGGIVLWYDLAYDNPRNPDVRGISLEAVRALFPEAASIRARRITLAPPIARRVASHRFPLYAGLNMFPFLRTHLLCAISKG